MYSVKKATQKMDILEIHLRLLLEKGQKARARLGSAKLGLQKEKESERW